MADRSLIFKKILSNYKNNKFVYKYEYMLWTLFKKITYTELPREIIMNVLL